MIRRPFGWSAGLYILWTAATYLLEGRLLTLLRPEAVGARLAYVVVANVLIGTLGALWVWRRLVDSGTLAAGPIGFRPPRQIAISVAAGAVLGSGAYLLQRAPSLDPWVVLNGFCQTLPVSIAEVLVCWAVIGGLADAVLRPRGRTLAIVAAVIIPSALFGFYHVAHSPPFNALPTIAILSAVGVVTSIYFLVARDVYGTIIFHNAFATFGVVQALAAADALASYAEPKVPLYVMAAVAIGVLILGDALWLRRRS